MDFLEEYNVRFIEDQDLRERYWLILTGFGRIIDGLVQLFTVGSCLSGIGIYFSKRLARYRFNKRNNSNRKFDE